jgi:hypothetical protein
MAAVSIKRQICTPRTTAATRTIKKIKNMFRAITAVSETISPKPKTPRDRHHEKHDYPLRHRHYPLCG